MTIDLKWGLPVYVATVFVALVKWAVFLAGVTLSLEGRGVTAFVAVCMGVFAGVAVGIMHIEGIRWNVTIGGRKDD